MFRQFSSSNNLSKISLKMEYYQNYRPYTNEDQLDSSVTQIEYNEFDYENSSNGKVKESRHTEIEFSEQKSYIDYGALRGDQARPAQGRHSLQPANAWHRGHAKCKRCTG